MTFNLKPTKKPSKWVTRRSSHRRKVPRRWHQHHLFPRQTLNCWLHLLTSASRAVIYTSWRRITSTSIKMRWTTTWSVTSACNHSSGPWTHPADTPTARSVSPVSFWRATSAPCAAHLSCCRTAGSLACWCKSCWTSWLWLAPSLTIVLKYCAVEI